MKLSLIKEGVPKKLFFAKWGGVGLNQTLNQKIYFPKISIFSILDVQYIEKIFVMTIWYKAKVNNILTQLL